MKYIEEGKAKLFIPLAEKIDKRMPVFYNPARELERSISALFVKVYQKEVGKRLEALDLLAASGVRGIRIALEANPKRVVLNDVNPQAYELMKRNVELNQLKQVEVKREEANRLLFSSPEKYDYIDVDPFGSPIPFLDAAVRRVRKQGILAVTSTDVAPLVGTYPITCLRRYGARSARVSFSTELGLRILMKKVMEIGFQYDCALVPLLSFYGGFYFRAYFCKRVGAGECNSLLEEISFISLCKRCLRREIGEKERCECGSEMLKLGPLWCGELISRELVKQMNELQPIPLLSALCEEERVGIPFHYTTYEFSSLLRFREPRIEELIEKLRGSGYEAARTHFSPKGFKTNAPIEEVKRML